MSDDKSRRALFNALKDKYELGPDGETDEEKVYQHFSKKMDSEDSRRKFYNQVSQKYDIGSWDEFQDKIGPERKYDEKSGVYYYEGQRSFKKKDSNDYVYITPDSKHYFSSEDDYNKWSKANQPTPAQVPTTPEAAAQPASSDIQEKNATFGAFNPVQLPEVQVTAPSLSANMPRPVKNTGESDADFQRRLEIWEGPAPVKYTGETDENYQKRLDVWNEMQKEAIGEEQKNILRQQYRELTKNQSGVQEPYDYKKVDWGNDGTPSFEEWKQSPEYRSQQYTAKETEYMRPYIEDVWNRNILPLFMGFEKQAEEYGEAAADEALQGSAFSGGGVVNMTEPAFRAKEAYERETDPENIMHLVMVSLGAEQPEEGEQVPDVPEVKSAFGQAIARYLGLDSKTTNSEEQDMYNRLFDTFRKEGVDTSQFRDIADFKSRMQDPDERHSFFQNNLQGKLQTSDGKPMTEDMFSEMVAPKELSEEEIYAVNARYSQAQGIAGAVVRDLMYNTLVQLNLPTDNFDDIMRGMEGSMIGSLVGMMVEQGARTNGLRRKIRQQAASQYEQGKPYWEGKLLEGARGGVGVATDWLPFMISGGASKLLTEGAAKLTFSALGRSMAYGSAKYAAVTVSANPVVRFVANSTINTLTGMGTFGGYGFANNVVQQADQTGKVDWQQALNAGFDESKMGLYMGVTGSLGSLWNAGSRATKIAKAFTTFAVEDATFTAKQVLDECTALGVNPSELTWADIAGAGISNTALLLTLKADPMHLRDNIAKVRNVMSDGKDAQIGLTNHHEEMLKAQNLGFNDFLTSLKGKSREEANKLTQEYYKKVADNKQVSQEAKKWIRFYLNGDYVMDAPITDVSGENLSSGKVKLTFKDFQGNIVDEKIYTDRKKALSDLQSVQKEILQNNTAMLMQTNYSPKYYMNESVSEMAEKFGMSGKDIVDIINSGEEADKDENTAEIKRTFWQSVSDKAKKYSQQVVEQAAEKVKQETGIDIETAYKTKNKTAQQKQAMARFNKLLQERLAHQQSVDDMEGEMRKASDAGRYAKPEDIKPISDAYQEAYRKLQQLGGYDAIRQLMDLKGKTPEEIESFFSDTDEYGNQKQRSFDSETMAAMKDAYMKSLQSEGLERKRQALIDQNVSNMEEAYKPFRYMGPDGTYEMRQAVYDGKRVFVKLPEMDDYGNESELAVILNADGSETPVKRSLLRNLQPAVKWDEAVQAERGNATRRINEAYDYLKTQDLRKLRRDMEGKKPEKETAGTEEQKTAEQKLLELPNGKDLKGDIDEAIETGEPVAETIDYLSIYPEDTRRAMIDYYNSKTEGEKIPVPENETVKSEEVKVEGEEQQTGNEAGTDVAVEAPSAESETEAPEAPIAEGGAEATEEAPAKVEIPQKGGQMQFESVPQERTIEYLYGDESGMTPAEVGQYVDGKIEQAIREAQENITDNPDKALAAINRRKYWEGVRDATQSQREAVAAEQQKAEAERKQEQADIISQTNPSDESMPGHTWVESADDILTFEEAVKDFSGTPDYTLEDAEKALKSGEITVYSSYPIENGVFVTPSKMEAENYAGGGKVYSKKMKTSDIAWLDSNEGQVAMKQTPEDKAKLQQQKQAEAEAKQQAHEDEVRKSVQDMFDSGTSFSRIEKALKDMKTSAPQDYAVAKAYYDQRKTAEREKRYGDKKFLSPQEKMNQNLQTIWDNASDAQTLVSVEMYGRKFLWDDAGSTKGVKNHLFGSKHNSLSADERLKADRQTDKNRQYDKKDPQSVAMRKWLGTADQGAKTPEEVAHDIWESLNNTRFGGELDVQDVLNIILDNLRSYSSPKEMYDDIYGTHIQKVREEKEREEEMQKDYYAREDGFESWQDYEDFKKNRWIGVEKPMTDDDIQDYYDTFADDITQEQEYYDKVRQGGTAQESTEVGGSSQQLQGTAGDNQMVSGERLDLQQGDSGSSREQGENPEALQQRTLLQGNGVGNDRDGEGSTSEETAGAESGELTAEGQQLSGNTPESGPLTVDEIKQAAERNRQEREKKVADAIAQGAVFMKTVDPKTGKTIYVKKIGEKNIPSTFYEYREAQKQGATVTDEVYYKDKQKLYRLEKLKQQYPDLDTVEKIDSALEGIDERLNANISKEEEQQLQSQKSALETMKSLLPAEAMLRARVEGTDALNNADKRPAEERLDQAVDLFSGSLEQPEATPAPKIPKAPRKTNSNTGKLDDFGEKIYGARKDLLRETAKKYSDLSLQALIAEPFAKAFKKPDLTKMVKEGVLREDDARYIESIITHYLSTPKPRPGKKDRLSKYLYGKSQVEIWADKAYEGVKAIADFMNMSEEERDNILSGLSVEQTQDAETAHIDELLARAGMETRKNPVNQIAFAFDVLRQMGWDSQAPVKNLISRIEPTDSGYKLYSGDNRLYLYNDPKTIDEAKDMAVFATKFNQGEETDIPADEMRLVAGSRVYSETGKYKVIIAGRLGSGYKEQIVDTKEEADKLVAEAHARNKYATAEPDREVTGYENYTIQVVDPISRERVKGTTVYKTKAEAEDAIANNYEAVCKELNEINAKLHDKTLQPKKRLRIAQVWESGLGWSYCIEAPEVVLQKTSGPEILAGGFSSQREAEEYLKAHESEMIASVDKWKQAQKAIEYFMPSEERRGEDYRHGKDSTPDDWMNTFGFRGVQFGNWTNAADRQKAMNEAYDAFMDLSKLLGISPKALSLNGRLGIAFGARGSGWASAHYELDQEVINLTKTKGAGSLAHEWLHAIDNYFSRLGGNEIGMVTATRQTPGMRDELRTAWNELMDAIYSTNYSRRSKTKGVYWGHEWELAARLFEDYVNRKLRSEGDVNSFLAQGVNHAKEENVMQLNYMLYKHKYEEQEGKLSEERRQKLPPMMSYEEFKKSDRALAGWPYPTVEEVNTLTPFLDKLFDTIQEKTDPETGKVALFQMTAGKSLREIERDRVKADITAVIDSEIRKAAAESEAAHKALRTKRAELLSIMVEGEQADSKTPSLFDVDADYSKENIENVLKPYKDRVQIADRTLSELRTKKNGRINQVLSEFDAQRALFEDSLQAGEEDTPKQPDSQATRNYAARTIRRVKASGVNVKLASKEDVDRIARDIEKNNGTATLLKLSDGTIYGWTDEDGIHITDKGFNPNTPAHEYGHAYMEMWKNADRKGYDEAVEALKASPVWQQVIKDPLYANLAGDESKIAGEVAARLVGKENERRAWDEGLDKTDILSYANARAVYNRALRAARQFWDWVQKNVFGMVKPMQAEDVVNRILGDLGKNRPMEKVLSEMNKQQKLSTNTPAQIDLSEMDASFQVTRNTRGQIERWLGKRKDLDENDKDMLLDYLDKNVKDNKTQLATGWWFAKGTVRIPEDMPKIEQAMKVAAKAKVDPLRYSSPMELINEHQDIEIKSERINPDTVSTLSNRKEIGHGIVIYDVEDSQQSRENMREIINTHFGKDCSPWCLLQGDENGKLTEESQYYWDHYNSYPKQVAFKDGKLLAFSANDNYDKVWWDRQDEDSHGFHITTELKNDKQGRMANVIWNPDTGEETIGKIFKGNRKDGDYYEWNIYDYERGDNVITREEHRVNGKLQGTQMYVRNGLHVDEYNQGIPVVQRTYENNNGKPGGLMAETLFDEQGKQHGRSTNWHPETGIITKIQNFTHGMLDGLEQRWYSTGQKMQEIPWFEGDIYGHVKKWDIEGRLDYDHNYMGGQQSGLSVEYYYSKFPAPMYTRRKETFYEKGEAISTREFVDDNLLSENIVDENGGTLKRIYYSSEQGGGLQSYVYDSKDYSEHREETYFSNGSLSDIYVREKDKNFTYHYHENGTLHSTRNDLIVYGDGSRGSKIILGADGNIIQAKEGYTGFDFNTDNPERTETAYYAGDKGYWIKKSNRPNEYQVEVWLPDGNEYVRMHYNTNTHKYSSSSEPELTQREGNQSTLRGLADFMENDLSQQAVAERIGLADILDRADYVRTHENLAMQELDRAKEDMVSEGYGSYYAVSMPSRKAWEERRYNKDNAALVLYTYPPLQEARVMRQDATKSAEPWTDVYDKQPDGRYVLSQDKASDVYYKVLPSYNQAIRALRNLINGRYEGREVTDAAKKIFKEELAEQLYAKRFYEELAKGHDVADENLPDAWEKPGRAMGNENSLVPADVRKQIWDEVENDSSLRFKKAETHVYDVKEYDRKNGTELEVFANDLDSGNVTPRRYYHVGNTGEILNNYGIKGKITINKSAVNQFRHSQSSDHFKDTNDWLAAIMSLNDPIAITKYGQEGKSYRIYTKINVDGKDIAVGVDVNTVGQNVDITKIVTAFKRNTSRLFNSDEELLYPSSVDKIKQELGQFSSGHNPQRYEQVPALKQDSGQFSSGHNPQRYEHLPVSGGKDRNYSLIDQEKREKISSVIEKAAEKLKNSTITMVRSEEELDKLGLSESAKEGVKKNSAGFYDPETGKSYVYLPNVGSEAEGVRAVLHEAVGHEGLRNIVGKDNYDKWMGELERQLPSEARDKVSRRALQEAGGNLVEYARNRSRYTAIAMDEYLAEAAEKGETPGTWNKIKSAVRQMLRDVFGMDLELTDDDVRYLLWRSKKRLEGSDILSYAEDMAMRHKWNIGNKAEDTGIRSMFVGQKGLAMNPEAISNLKVAEDMEGGFVDENGKISDDDRLKIKLATGWERGADGKWRHEVVGVKWNEDALMKDRSWGSLVKLDEMIDDQGLFDIYPELRDITVQFGTSDPTNAGEYSSEYNIIGVDMLNDLKRINRNIKDYRQQLENVTDPTPTQISNAKVLGIEVPTKEMKTERLKKMLENEQQLLDKYKEEIILERTSTLNHEVQHAIQEIEGFAKGGHPENTTPEYDKKFNDVLNSIDKILDNLDKQQEAQEKISARMNDIWEGGKLTEESKAELDALGKKFDALSVVMYETSQTLRSLRDTRSLLTRYPETLGYDGYYKLAGEVESRMSGDRAGLSEEEIRTTLATPSVPVEEQILRFGKNGSSMEVSMDDKPSRREGESDEIFNARIERWKRKKEREAQKAQQALSQATQQLDKDIASATEKVSSGNDMNPDQTQQNLIGEAEKQARMKRNLEDAFVELATKQQEKKDKIQSERDRFTELMDQAKIRVDRKGWSNSIKDEIRERRRTIETGNFEDAVIAHDIRKKTTADERRRLPFMIEGSEQTPPHLVPVVEQIRSWFDDIYNVMTQEGLFNGKDYSNYINNYVTHIWDFDKSDPDAVALMRGYIRMSDPYTRTRVISTYKEGIEKGLKPKYDDITDIMLNYGHYATEVIANRRMVNFLRNFEVEVKGKDGKSYYMPVLDDADVKDADYVRVDNNALDGYKVYKGVVNDVNVVFGKQHWSDSKMLQQLGEKYDLTGSVMKKINLSLSFFHHMALTETAVGMLGPVSFGKVLVKNMMWDAAMNKEGVSAFNDVEATRDAIKHFVSLGATNDYAAADVQNMTSAIREKLEELSGKVGLDGNKKYANPLYDAALTADWINKGMDTVLWDWMHDGYKIYSFKKIAGEIRNEAEKQGWSSETLEKALDEAGQLVNDTFGGQHWDIMGQSPSAVKWYRRLLLSPDWTISTLRQALAPFGVGRLYNDDGFWKQFDKSAKPAAMRRKYAAIFWANAALTFIPLWNALNAYYRWKDEEEEKSKADEIRKTDPGYKSPYELAYPDGMKWYDYTMLGNTRGHQTHLFVGRYDDGEEMYLRWGKQFRELPELFFGRDGFSFPGPMIDKIAGKLNPMISTATNFIGGVSPTGYENSWMKDKKGWDRELGRLCVLLSAFTPYSIPTEQDKEFVASSLVMPNSKGYKPYKARTNFEVAIKSGDMDLVGQVYNACVMNGLDAEDLYKTTYNSVMAETRKAMTGAYKDVNEAANAYEKETDPKKRKWIAGWIKGQLGAEDTKQIERAEFLDKVENGELDGEESAEGAKEYARLNTSADVIADWRLTKAKKGLEQWHDEYVKLDGKISARRDPGAEYRKNHKEVDQWYIFNRAMSEMSDMKKLLVDEHADQEKIMNTIRTIRKNALEFEGTYEQYKRKYFPKKPGLKK